MDKQQGPTVVARRTTHTLRINRDGKEYFLNVCVKLSDFALQKRLAQYCKLAILQLKIYIYILFFKEDTKTIATKK